MCFKSYATILVQFKGLYNYLGSAKLTQGLMSNFVLVALVVSMVFEKLSVILIKRHRACLRSSIRGALVVPNVSIKVIHQNTLVVQGVPKVLQN